MKLLACILVSGIFQLANAGQIELGLRAQVNAYRFYNDPSQNIIGKSSSFSPGINLQISTSATSFIRASALIQKRNYQLNYISGDATFIQSELSLTEMELSLGKYLFSRGKDQGFYLNAGIQALWRNWGEESYRQAVIDNTYWPNARLSSMFGFGYSFYTSSGMKMYIGANMNNFIDQKMAYEKPTHQYALYLIFNGVFKYKAKSAMQTKCFNQF